MAKAPSVGRQNNGVWYRFPAFEVIPRSFAGRVHREVGETQSQPEPSSTPRLVDISPNRNTPYETWASDLATSNPERNNRRRPARWGGNSECPEWAFRDGDLHRKPTSLE